MADTRNGACLRLLGRLGLRPFATLPAVFRGQACLEQHWVARRERRIALGLRPARAADGEAVVAEIKSKGGAAQFTKTDATLIPSSPGGDFGFDTATCDVNGDGYADVLASQQGYSGSNGRVYAYYGSASGVSTSVGARSRSRPNCSIRTS